MKAVGEGATRDPREGTGPQTQYKISVLASSNISCLTKCALACNQGF